MSFFDPDSSSSVDASPIENVNIAPKRSSMNSNSVFAKNVYILYLNLKSKFGDERAFELIKERIKVM